jgi:hypothetical protein
MLRGLGAVCLDSRAMGVFPADQVVSMDWVSVYYEGAQLRLGIKRNLLSKTSVVKLRLLSKCNLGPWLRYRCTHTGRHGRTLGTEDLAAQSRCRRTP